MPTSPPNHAVFATCVAVFCRDLAGSLPLLPPITPNVKLSQAANRLECGVREEIAPDATSQSGKNGNVDHPSQLCRPAPPGMSATPPFTGRLRPIPSPPAFLHNPPLPPFLRVGSRRSRGSTATRWHTLRSIHQSDHEAHMRGSYPYLSLDLHFSSASSASSASSVVKSVHPPARGGACP